MTCLRRIKGISKMDRIQNLDIRKGLGMQRDVVNRIQERRLHYFGHVTRMNCSRCPQIAMYGRVQGTRERGRPKKRWMDVISMDCMERGVTVPEATHITADQRDAWRSFVVRMPKLGKPVQWQ